MGNVGSGFGVPAARCGFEDGYYPAHALLGFPNCANYKGTPDQRYADLQRRGYGTAIINAWKKYYAENPSDPNKIDYTKQDPNINNSMSKKAALAEQAAIISAKGSLRTYGTFADRTRQTREYNANQVKHNIVARTETINAILKNPDNIERWNKEELKKQEDERLIQIQQELENQEITFNEQKNSGDFNETPITEINLDNSCSECTETIKSTDPIEEKQLNENYLKIGGIAAVGIGILLLYTRRNKK
jgi:hypothetical protein